MKKIVLFFVCATMLVACDNFGKKQKDLQAQNDSLQSELTQKNAELEEMMETLTGLFAELVPEQLHPPCRRDSSLLPSARAIPHPDPAARLR